MKILNINLLNMIIYLIKAEKDVMNKTNQVLKLLSKLPINAYRIKISENMKKGVFDFVECVGVWNPISATIIIKRFQLTSVECYSATLIHEIGHAISGASDNSRKFENSLTDIIGYLAQVIVKLNESEKV